MYTKQKKRNNFYIFLNDFFLGCILYHLKINEILLSVVRRLEPDYQADQIKVLSYSVDFSNFIIPYSTFVIRIVPVGKTMGKFVRVKNCLCLPTNLREKKS